uniref:DNA damage-binding protein 1 n=1 Tax=Coccolithus braarudii TaxID=221442 RepID=A0A7S0PY64_9EUKA|mmetsp:Transcript_21443/g.46106  ORF Transcript_21443/g.46106 Transcript_21443/m.46106 type:complete len:1202 (+) Transcript_21443:91-3696(+)
MVSLYCQTLQRSCAITAAVYGNFSGPKMQELAVARGKILELLRPDENDKVQTIYATEVFGIIRSISTFRLTGGNRDYLVVGSDSGKIVILEFSPERACFERIHGETYGKSGIRRIVPGQFVSADPRGRALMVSATEKQKLVYILNRDSAARLTISSPLEAHKSSTITFDIVGVDVGFDNPIFAAIEVDAEEVENDQDTNEVLYEKNLVFYELDLGLNHVVRKWADPVDPTSNHLVRVPGGNEGPGGVLVCSENFVVYKNQSHTDVRCALPRRRDLSEEHGLLIIASAVHRQKDLFFIIIQSEFGDLYKVTLQHEEEQVHEVKVRYFDTLPACRSLCILRSGYLFAGSEFGNLGFYQFQGVGEDEDAPMCSSTAFDGGDESVVELQPQPLRNLLHVDDIDSLCPLIDAKLLDLERGAPPTLAALCGRSARSTLRMVQHGLAVTEMAVSELPGNPNAVWTVKRSRSDETDAYIVVSFVNATLVLSIGETVEEVTDSGLKPDTPTLSVALLGEDSIVQVYPNGVFHIRADGRVSEWKAPRGKPIVKATSNARQLAIALAGGELIYFELDAQSTLAEVDKKDTGHEVTCLDLGAVPAGRQRARFLAAGGFDSTIRILSLDPDDCMNVLAVLALPAQAESVAVLSMPVGRAGGAPALFLCIGLHNGVMLRARLDSRSGQLSDTRTRFVGAKPVKVFRVPLGGCEGVLVLSSRSWVVFCLHNTLHVAPLTYQQLEHGCSFASEHCPEGLVAIASTTLRILALEKLGDTFNSDSMPLRYTPRHLVRHSVSGNIVLIESDHNAYSEEEKAQLYQAAGISPPLPAGTVLPEDDEADGMLMEANVGVPRAGPGKWASCIRVVSPVERQTLCVLELSDNEAAVSLACVPMRERNGETMLVVGTVKDMTLHPRTLSAAFLHVYQFTDNNATIELVHKTQVEDVPSAIAPFGGRLLVGVGKTLRIYDMGQKKLLRKAELKALPTMIQSVHVLSASRIVVGDLAESFHFISYKRSENQLSIFADDISPRWLTCATPLDINTLVGGDKFGNIYICRLPQEVSDDVDDAQLLSATAGREGAALNGAPSKAEEIAQFHIGETVTSLQKVTLGPGCSEVILYTTLLGGIGALLPITHKDDLEFLTALEMHMRQEAAPLCGRDQLFFRSSYFPVKGVVDGDYLQLFNGLSHDEQKSISDELDRTPAEISKKLEELATRVI